MYNQTSTNGHLSTTATFLENIPGGSVAEWSARRTRNPAVPGSSPALATCWICTGLSRAQILGHACK